MMNWQEELQRYEFYADGQRIDSEAVLGAYSTLVLCVHAFGSDTNLRSLAAYFYTAFEVRGIPIEQVVVVQGDNVVVEYGRRDADVRLFLNCAHPRIHFKEADGSGHVQSDVILGDRQFSPLYKGRHLISSSQICKLLDSGAFSDQDDQRLTPESALQRQLAFERWCEDAWNEKWRNLGANYREPWQADIICSYDWLIGPDTPPRAAAHRVQVTIENARYLAKQRRHLEPRQLMFLVQGQTPQQYALCLERILEFAQRHDMIGFGGWSYLGRTRRKRDLVQLFETMQLCVALLRDSGLYGGLHLMGVAGRLPLGLVLRECDRLLLPLSADTTTLVRSAVTRDKRKVAPWSWTSAELDIVLKKTAIATLREFLYYRRHLWR